MRNEGSTIDRAAAAIEERLAELEDERGRLSNALSSLSGGSSTRGPRGHAKRTGGRGRSQRAKRGEREAQLLSSIEQNPSFKPVDHARVIGVSPSQIYGLVAKMTAAGAIRKTPKGSLRVKKAS